MTISTIIDGLNEATNNFKSADNKWDKLQALTSVFEWLKVGYSDEWDNNMMFDFFSGIALDAVLQYLGTLSSDSQVRIMIVRNMDNLLNGSGDVNSKYVVGFSGSFYTLWKRTLYYNGYVFEYGYCRNLSRSYDGAISRANDYAIEYPNNFTYSVDLSLCAQ